MTRRLCGCWDVCDHGESCHCVGCQVSDGFCTCDGDPRVDQTCGIARHRRVARSKIFPLPPVNRLLAATVDDEPAEPLA